MEQYEYIDMEADLVEPASHANVQESAEEMESGDVYDEDSDPSSDAS